ncbi:NAD(P)-binding protein [Pseudonocardia sp. GCM10023141]|uniref:NAD(P)-binding protein n=1 Tax=Pseudonocardia sp. GCM10023141 TaxID=3252653 RepID=UPI003606F9A3
MSHGPTRGGRDLTRGWRARAPSADDQGIDAVVVGCGTNGLVGAVRLATSGRRVLLVEAADTLGGGLRTEEVTLPGFRHDLCATVVPLATASPAMRALDPGREGVVFDRPPTAAAHPFDDAPAALVRRDLAATAAASVPTPAGGWPRSRTPPAGRWSVAAPSRSLTACWRGCAVWVRRS